MATETEIKEAFDAGAASARAHLNESDEPLLMVDEFHDDELATANAKGWNSVWASEENSRRWNRNRPKLMVDEAHRAPQLGGNAIQMILETNTRN